MKENEKSDMMEQKSIMPDLAEQSVRRDPVRQFEIWFQEAIAAGIPEANAMTLATCGIDFKPSARMVLLKGLEDGKFIFYTNYHSRKGNELLWNPYAALLFYWHEMHRQVRIEGRVEKLPNEVSDAYFKSRPAPSKLSAIISPQSEVIPGRDFLDEKLIHLKNELSENEIQRPDYWGGYQVQPYTIEFWQGRDSRLHDRLLFTRVADDWKMERLAP